MESRVFAFCYVGVENCRIKIPWSGLCTLAIYNISLWSLWSCNRIVMGLGCFSYFFFFVGYSQSVKDNRNDTHSHTHTNTYKLAPIRTKTLDGRSACVVLHSQPMGCLVSVCQRSRGALNSETQRERAHPQRVVYSNKNNNNKSNKNDAHGVVASRSQTTDAQTILFPNGNSARRVQECAHSSD